MIVLCMYSLCIIRMDLSRLISPQKNYKWQKDLKKNPGALHSGGRAWRLARERLSSNKVDCVCFHLLETVWSRWVSTDYVDIFAHDGDQHREAFDKLFQFISGKNSDSVEIPMTAPVTFRFVQQSKITCSRNSQNNSRRGSTFTFTFTCSRM